jgi:hypothetical protein
MTSHEPFRNESADDFELDVRFYASEDMSPPQIAGGISVGGSCGSCSTCQLCTDMCGMGVEEPPERPAKKPPTKKGPKRPPAPKKSRPKKQ